MGAIYSIYSESICRLEKSQSYLENLFTYHSVRLKNSSKITMQFFYYKAIKNREHFCCYPNKKVREGFVVVGVWKKTSESIKSISIPSTKADTAAHQVWWGHQDHRRRKSDKATDASFSCIWVQVTSAAANQTMPGKFPGPGRSSVIQLEQHWVTFSPSQLAWSQAIPGLSSRLITDQTPLFSSCFEGRLSNPAEKFLLLLALRAEIVPSIFSGTTQPQSLFLPSFRSN